MFAGFRLKTETWLQPDPVLVTTARLLTSSMATPPGAAAVPFGEVGDTLQGARGISSNTAKSMTFEVTKALSATSRAKCCGPVKNPAGNVTSSSWLPFKATVAPSVLTSVMSRRTFDVPLKPEPKILTGPAAGEGAPRVTLTAAVRLDGTVIFAGSSTAGDTKRSMCSGLMFPSWKIEMLLLPEFTAIARLSMESTASAPGKLTLRAAVEPLGVKLATPSAV